MKIGCKKSDKIPRGQEISISEVDKTMSALLEASKILTSTFDLQEVLKFTVEKVVEIMELADAGILLLYDERKGKLRVEAAFGYGPEIFQISVKPRMGGGPGAVFLSGQALLWTSAEQVDGLIGSLQPRERSLLEKARKGLPRSASVLCAPCIVREKVIGSIQLEHYRDQLIFTGSDLALLQALADLIAIAVDNAQLHLKLQEKEATRGELLAKLISAQEDERKRIARELHDETSQALTALIINLESIQDTLPDALTFQRERLQTIKTNALQVLDELRTMALNLRPPMLDDLGLRLALDWYIKEQLEECGLSIELKVTGLEQRFSFHVETILFRIVQEALANVVQHSRATHVDIRLSLADSKITLLVEDNGEGFDVEEVLGPNRTRQSLGIFGIRERASLCGGTFSINSRPGQGTRLLVEIPVGEPCGDSRV